MREGAAAAPRRAFPRLSPRGALARSQDLAAQAPNMMNQSNVMMESMKGQFGMIIPNMLMIGWLTYFFSGFVIGAPASRRAVSRHPHQDRAVKLPFSLTAGFKVMLQRGVELRSAPAAALPPDAVPSHRVAQHAGHLLRELPVVLLPRHVRPPRPAVAAYRPERR